MSKKKKVSSLNPLPDLPDAFIREMEGVLGPSETALLVDALREEPSVSIRLNKRKVRDSEAFMRRIADFSPSDVEWCGSGYYLEKRPDFVHDPLLHAGAYYVQEGASMVYQSLVEKIVRETGSNDKGAPLKVLDLCAAPGGKSTAILNALPDNSLLVANEFDRGRSKILKENLDKWGEPNVIVTNSPTARFASLTGYFDIVAVDAPCSGEGMMRREPMARSQWSTGLVESCSSLQRDILEDAEEALRPGGFLIYSTCTFNRMENEGNVSWLKEEKGLSAVSEPRRFMPHKNRCEGLFVVVMQKPEDPDFHPYQPKYKPGKGLGINSDSVFIDTTDSVFERIGNRIFCIPTALLPTLELLKRNDIPLLGAGTEVGTEKGSLFIPSSRQVLSRLFNGESLPSVELTLENAVAYLRRMPLTLDPAIPKGYVAVQYEGHTLGLVKNLGNRSNNLYPSEWRVLT